MEKARDALVTYIKTNIHAEITGLETYNAVMISLPDVSDDNIYDYNPIYNNIQDYPFYAVVPTAEDDVQTLSRQYIYTLRFNIYTGMKNNNIGLSQRQMLRYTLALKNILKKAAAYGIGDGFMMAIQEVEYYVGGNVNNYVSMSETKIIMKRRE